MRKILLAYGGAVVVAVLCILGANDAFGQYGNYTKHMADYYGYSGNERVAYISNLTYTIETFEDDGKVFEILDERAYLIGQNLDLGDNNDELAHYNVWNETTWNDEGLKKWDAIKQTRLDYTESGIKIVSVNVMECFVHGDERLFCNTSKDSTIFGWTINNIGIPRNMTVISFMEACWDQSIVDMNYDIMDRWFANGSKVTPEVDIGIDGSCRYIVADIGMEVGEDLFTAVAVNGDSTNDNEIWFVVDRIDYDRIDEPSEKMVEIIDGGGTVRETVTVVRVENLVEETVEEIVETEDVEEVAEEQVEEEVVVEEAVAEHSEVIVEEPVEEPRVVIVEEVRPRNVCR